MKIMDSRYLLLQDWLKTTLPHSFSIKALAGDASFRRYFRVHHDKTSFVVMDAPPSHENIASFIDITTRLHQHQIKAPIIFQRDLEKGFLLLSDLGDNLFLPLLNEQTVETLYGQALSTLHRMQNCETLSLPHFNDDMILREFSLFVEWFLEKHLKLSLTFKDKTLLNDVFSLLNKNSQEQPQCFVHRDYHSRNLLTLPNAHVGVIDFQDAVLGPITYDLISLIRDCYIDWPKEHVHRWLINFHQQALDLGRLNESSSERFIRWADLQSIQRHLKAIGIFSRLNYRDNKSNYLNDIPRTFNYVKNLTSQYRELLPFNQWLSEKIPL